MTHTDTGAVNVLFEKTVANSVIDSVVSHRVFITSVCVCERGRDRKSQLEGKRGMHTSLISHGRE